MSYLQCQCSLPHQFPWYALQTRSRMEQLAAVRLQAKGYEQYFPYRRVHRRWSDRSIEAIVPFFPGYIFCRFDVREKLPVVTTAGVAAVVGFGAQPVPVPEREIEAIQTVLRSGANAEPLPFLKEGQRIHVTHGALRGLEGILLKRKSDWKLVICVPLLQRSISVEIEKSCVTAA